MADPAVGTAAVLDQLRARLAQQLAALPYGSRDKLVIVEGLRSFLQDEEAQLHIALRQDDAVFFDDEEIR